MGQPARLVYQAEGIQNDKGIGHKREPKYGEGKHSPDSRAISGRHEERGCRGGLDVLEETQDSDLYRGLPVLVRKGGRVYLQG